MVDLDVTKTTEMDIISVGTGWDIPEECGKYLGTAQDFNGYVWHYFVYKIKEIEKAPKEGNFFVEDLAVLAQLFGQTGSTLNETTEQFCKMLAGAKKEEI